jgi:subtilase family serine protease
METNPEAKTCIQAVTIGYNVKEITEIYGFNLLPYKEVNNGPSLNIAIVIAYSYPNLQADLDSFCSLNNIPTTKLNIVKMNVNTPSSRSWTTEICLDTQWLHAICPYAIITVVEAESASLTHLSAAITTTNNLNPKPNIVNMSWVFQEFQGCNNINIFDSNILYVASSGDDNYVSWPSSNPNILCIAATTLNANNNNNFISETTWIDSGCGPSAYFPIPNYQKNNLKTINSSYRQCADISIDGNPKTGCYIYSDGSYFIVGGTSLSAPIIAGTMGIILYQRLLNNKPLYNSSQNSSFGIQNILYNLYGNNINNIYNYLFYDVTKGSSGKYNAELGYDNPTGLGSPFIPTFVPYLVNDTIIPAYEVQVKTQSHISYNLKDSNSGSASCIISVSASSHDLLEKEKIEASLISHLEDKLIFDHLLGLIPKENIDSYTVLHNHDVNIQHIL